MMANFFIFTPHNTVGFEVSQEQTTYTTLDNNLKDDHQFTNTRYQTLTTYNDCFAFVF
jgi:hypothetical protein